MEGAIEIAKLRFWLWLISQVDPIKVEGKKLETLPNLDFNLMVGNSLIGFVNIEDIEFDFVRKQKTLTSWLGESKIEWLKNLAKEKKKFKTLPAPIAIKLREKLNKELEAAREFLNEEFYNSISTIIINYIRSIQKKYNKFRKNNKEIEKLKAEIKSTFGKDLFNKIITVNLNNKEEMKALGYELFKYLKPFHWGFEFYEVFDLERSSDERGFDVIIGNPPHGNLLSDIEKMWIRKIHKYSQPNNIAEVFLERCFSQLKIHGRIGYIIPKTIGFYHSWNKIRDLILNGHLLESILDVGIGFIGVIAEQLCIIIQKISSHDKERIKENNVRIYVGEPLKSATHGKQIKFVGNVPQTFMQMHNVLIFRPLNRIERDIIKHIDTHSTKFREIYERAFRGLFIYEKEKSKYIGKGSVFFIEKEPAIQQFYVKDWTTIMIKPLWKKKVKEILQPKLIFKVLRGSRIVVFCDYEGKFLTTSNISNVVLKDQYKHLLSSLEVILNSPLLSFYAQKMLFSETTESARHWDDPYVGELPIIIPSKPFRIAASQLGHYLHFLKKYYWDKFLSKNCKGLEIENLLNELTRIVNCLVYELYFKKKFKQNGIKTELLKLVKQYFRDTSDLKSDIQRLQVIKEVVENIKNDKRIMDLISRIKSHPWVRVIEGR